MTLTEQKCQLIAVVLSLARTLIFPLMLACHACFRDACRTNAEPFNFLLANQEKFLSPLIIKAYPSSPRQACDEPRYSYCLQPLTEPTRVSSPSLFMNIGIVSTGIGNVGSIERMVAYVGAESTTISSPHQVFEAEAIILPGVGYFSHGMEALVQAGLDRPLIEVAVQKRIPILGICLGMQLLCEYSEEGDCGGLGLIKAQVKKFNPSCQPGLKVPHMGWNSVQAVRDNPLLPENQGPQRFYFVHSFYVNPVASAIVIGETTHGHSFCSAFQQGNIFGVQFHPEKSHRYGAALIRNFIENASDA